MKRRKNEPPKADQGATDPSASPVTRFYGGNTDPPVVYADLDYLPQEDELRHAAHGPRREWAQVQPPGESPGHVTKFGHPRPKSQANLRTDAKTHMKRSSLGTGWDF